MDSIHRCIAMDHFKTTLLIVEDEAIIAVYEAEYLTSNGYEVKLAHNAADAIELLRNNNQIDLILMDIDLGAGMDGITAAAEIMKFSSVPIIYLSSHAEKTIFKEIKNNNIHGYIQKESGGDILLEIIRATLEKERPVCG